MKVIKLVALAVSVGVMLTACKPADNSAPAAATASPTGSAEGVVSAPEVIPTEPPVAQVTQVLDSQLGPGGSTWDLTKVAVVGQIMTVQFTVKPAPGKSSLETGQKIGDVSVIDDSTSQRYTVLKDDSGRPMASPLQSSGDALRLDAGIDEPIAVWLKFPAVPASSSSVSITIPKVGAFDGVQVQR